MMTINQRLFVSGAAVLALLVAGCGTTTTESLPATATLAPIVSLTPRFTATPIPSSTPLPSQTPTPSLTFTVAPPTLTFTPSSTPPILGSVYSLQDVNMREGPGVSFPLITALRPGTGFTVLATDTSGAWMNIRLEENEEGWISATLVRLEPTETPEPSRTPTPNLTDMAAGTPLPTSILGGQPVTPTPPRSVITPTSQASATGLQLPDMASIDQTATALAGFAQSTIGVTPFASGQPLGGTQPVGGPTGGPLPSGSGTPNATLGSASSQDGVDVLAYCDNPIFGSPPPTNLAAGSTVDIYWSWYATTQEYLQDHLDAAVYDVRLDGEPVTGIFMPPPRTQSDGNIYQYYYARTQPLTPGTHEVTYTLSWRVAIFDGEANYGPGTARVTETGTCTFRVR
jgi:hypothetical protein